MAGWKMAAAIVVVAVALMVTGHDGFDLGEGSDSAVNSLSDVDTGEDIQAFDSAYDSTLVDKVVDKDFDPDKLFSSMEKLGEARARKLQKQNDQDMTPLPDVHSADVDQAADELQQQAALAESIAKHPAHFHSLRKKRRAQEEAAELQSMLGEAGNPPAALRKSPDTATKAEAEAKLHAAESAVAAYGIRKAERKAENDEAKAALKQDAARLATQKPTATSSVAPVNDTPAQVAPAKDAPAKDASAKEDTTKAKAAADEAPPKAKDAKKPGEQDKAKGGQSQHNDDPVSGKASPDAKAKADKSKRQAEENKKAAEKKNKEAAGKAAGDPLAGGSAVPAKDSQTSAETPAKEGATADPPAKEAPAPAQESKSKDVAPAKDAAAKDAAAKDAPTKDTAAKDGPKSSGDTNAKSKGSAQDYFMDAAKALKGGATAKQLLAMAKVAFAKEKNPAKAKAFLAAAEEAQAKKEEEASKPTEDLLDVLRKKQGHAIKMNAASLAAQRAVNAMGLKADHKKSPKKQGAGSNQLAKLSSTLAPADDDAEKEARDAEAALHATQRAARVAIAKAKARVAAARAKTANANLKVAHVQKLAALAAEKKAQVAMTKAKKSAHPSKQQEVHNAKAAIAAAKKAETKEHTEIDHEVEKSITSTVKGAHKGLKKEAMKLQKGALNKSDGPVTKGKDAFGFSGKSRAIRQQENQKKKEAEEASKAAAGVPKDQPETRKESEDKQEKKAKAAKDTEVKKSKGSKSAPAPPPTETFGFAPAKKAGAPPAKKTAASPAPAPEAPAKADAPEKAATPTHDSPAKGAPAKDAKDASAAPTAPAKAPEAKATAAKSLDEKMAKLGDALHETQLDKVKQEHSLMRNAGDLHLWVNGKPVDSVALKAKDRAKEKNAKKTASEKSEKVRLMSMDPKKEVAVKSDAAKVSDNLHIWVNGRPQVLKAAKKMTKPVVESMVHVVSHHEDLGESAQIEGLEQMRAMKLVAKHVQDTSKALDMQNQISPDTEYNFSIRNTDKHDKSMGTAKNVHLDVDLPKAAKLNDAYFYLETTGKEEPASKNCKLIHSNGDDNPRVNCFVPYVRDVVDVYIRAHYDGDQQVLSKLTSEGVVGTLHEGHEVLTTSKLPAVARAKLLKRMPHE